MSSRSRIFVSKIALLEAILFFTTGTILCAQEAPLEEQPGFRERAVVMHIVSRIVEQNQEVVWNSENTRVTIPGRPVGLRLVGSNVIVAVQFTPFLRPSGRSILVAQGQIWVNVPDEGISYHTTMQTIPLEFSEQIYFFPLGSIDTKDEAYIEIQLVLEPYLPRSGQEGEEQGTSRRPQGSESRGSASGRTRNPENEGSTTPP